MRLGSKHFRSLQAGLDQLGITTNINRVGPKNYQMEVNYEIVKKYKTRAACNRYIRKLLDKHKKSS